MAFAQRVTNAPIRTTGTPCSVGAVEDHLTGPEADHFADMLYRLGWSYSRIYEQVQGEAKELQAKGDVAGAVILGRMAKSQINRHRSRGCRCFA